MCLARALLKIFFYLLINLTIVQLVYVVLGSSISVNSVSAWVILCQLLFVVDKACYL